MTSEMPSAWSNRNDVTIWTVGVLLSEMLARAEQWDVQDESVQLDFFLEWEEIVDRLRGVVEDERDGRLSAPQRRQLMDLADRLRNARPVIERLGLDYLDLD